MKKERIYLAYGSNLHLGQMSRRCPDAKPIGTAMLQDYQLLFRGGQRGAVATVEPKTGNRVPVLLWSISPRDERNLDYYEGFPFLYRKETVTVELNGKPTEAMVYIMNEGRPLGAPSTVYYNTILEGYRANGLDTCYLEWGLQDSLGGNRDDD